MAENKTNTGLLIAGGFLLLAGGAFLYFKNKDKKETKITDNTTADITDSETQQAMQLYNMLGVSNTFGWGLSTFHDIPEEKVLNLLLSVTNWKKLQEKFRGLCNNEYSLTKALSDGLDADEYQLAIQLASAKKVVTTTATTFIIYNGIVPLTKNIAANTVLGALKSETQTAYTFINAILDDDKELLASINKANTKLITP